MTDGDTPREAEFRQKCRELLARGVIPVPKIMGNLGFGNGRSLAGNFVKIRTEELLRFGYQVDPRSRKWKKVKR